MVVGATGSIGRSRCSGHFLLHRAAARVSVGVELDPNRVRTDIFQKDLYRDEVLVPLGLHADGAEADCVQFPRQGILPIDKSSSRRAVVGQVRPIRMRSGNVVLVGVLTHRPRGGKPGRQPRHAFAHARHPCRGYALFGTREEFGNHLSL